MHVTHITARQERQPSPERKPTAQGARIGGQDRGPWLTLVSRFNDDGHFCSLEPTWIPLGVAVGLVLSRMGGRL